MAACMKCNRTLPPNGVCVYCGGEEFRDTKFLSRRQSPLAAWVGRIVKIAVAVGLVYLAYWLVFTEEGGKAVTSLREKLGLTGGKHEPKTAAQKILMKYPKVAALFEDASRKVVEEQFGSTIFQVSFVKHEAGQLVVVAFTVNTVTELVTGADAEADAMLR